MLLSHHQTWKQSKHGESIMPRMQVKYSSGGWKQNSDWMYTAKDRTNVLQPNSLLPLLPVSYVMKLSWQVTPWSIVTIARMGILSQESSPVPQFESINSLAVSILRGFRGGAHGKEPTCQCRKHKRHGFDPWVGKSPYRRKWQPTLVFLPGESHGQGNLAG